MAPERDLFANFERMRREMDEIFGDVFSRSHIARRSRGFEPAVDVYYCGEPPKAIVKADLAGIELDSLELEIQGRDLTISGHRRPAEAEGRVYQQIEIEHGPFRRTIPLGAEVLGDQARAVYDNGILRIELPLAEAQPGITRKVPIEVPEADDGPGVIEGEGR
jgi:HSP20 family protein